MRELLSLENSIVLLFPTVADTCCASGVVGFCYASVFSAPILRSDIVHSFITWPEVSRGNVYRKTRRRDLRYSWVVFFKFSDFLFSRSSISTGLNRAQQLNYLRSSYDISKRI